MSDRPVNLAATITGGATSAKQDLLLAELQLKADLTETQPVSIATVPSHAVTNAGTFAVQVTSAPTTAITAAALPLPSGAATSALQGAGLPAALGAGGGVKIDGSGTALPVSGTFYQATQPVSEADGANVTLGAKADAKSTATDTTAVSIMSVLKEISYMEQTPASRAVTNAGTFAVQPGSAMTGPGNPTVDSYSSIAINLAAGADQSLVAAPGANKQIWVFGFAFTTNVAGTVSFQDEDNTALSGVMQIGITGGIAMSPSGNFAMPIWKVATNKALEVDVVTAELDGTLQYAIMSV